MCGKVNISGEYIDLDLDGALVMFKGQTIKQGGADRTGCLVYLLLGVLGVNENDLCKEWELTSFGCQGYRVRCSTSMNLQGFVAQLKTYVGNTLNEKIENFLIECGISSADIADFKSIMIG